MIRNVEFKSESFQRKAFVIFKGGQQEELKDVKLGRGKNITETFEKFIDKTDIGSRKSHSVLNRLKLELMYV